ncbi:MAG: hypothetical protein FJW40_24110 [Acidobacteria bacterium]|nr:hypothetical protein [Acidobacteriota bacterium]
MLKIATMNRTPAALLATFLAAASFSAAQGVKPDTVVATVNGRQVTAREMSAFVAAMPPQLQQFFEKDRKSFMQQYGLLDLIARIAEAGKVHEESPVRERLQYARMQILMEAQLQKAGASFGKVLSDADLRKLYDSSLDKYTQARVRVIYIAYSKNPVKPASPTAKKILSEAEAKAKAESLHAQIKAGADFTKLVREHSDDAASRDKDGDFGAIKRTDNIPEDIKRSVFSMKPGQVGVPLWQENGYYLLKLEGIDVTPFDQVKDKLFQEAQQIQMKEWFENTRRQVDIKIENDAFFAPPSTQTLQLPGQPQK